MHQKSVPCNVGFAGNAARDDYRQQLVEANKTGQCSFCEPNLSTRKNKPLEPDKWKHWWVKHNDFPYAHHRLHLVYGPKIHHQRITELTDEEWSEMKVLIKWIAETFQIPGECLVCRSGSAEVTSATIDHLHMHIQVPDLTGPAFAVFHWTNEHKKYMGEVQRLLGLPSWNLFPWIGTLSPEEAARLTAEFIFNAKSPQQR